MPDAQADKNLERLISALNANTSRGGFKKSLAENFLNNIPLVIEECKTYKLDEEIEFCAEVLEKNSARNLDKLNISDEVYLSMIPESMHKFFTGKIENKMQEEVQGESIIEQEIKKEEKATIENSKNYIEKLKSIDYKSHAKKILGKTAEKFKSAQEYVHSDEERRKKFEKIGFRILAAGAILFLCYQGCHDLSSKTKTGNKKPTIEQKVSKDDDSLKDMLNYEFVKFECHDVPCIKRYLSFMQKNLDKIKKHKNYDKASYERVQNQLTEIDGASTAEEMISKTEDIKNLNKEYNNLITNFVKQYNKSQ